MTGGDRNLGKDDFRTLREKWDLSREQLAALADVSFNTVVNFESGKTVNNDSYDRMVYVLTELDAGRPVVFAAGVHRHGSDRAGTFHGTPRDLTGALRKAQEIVDRARTQRP